MSQRTITVAGAGIVGLWHALLLARAGHRVRLVERSSEPFARSASRYGGAMLAPWCETESADAIVRDLGLRALELWREAYPEARFDGSLVLAQSRDRKELTRFARLTEGHEAVDAEKLAKLEPDLEGRFTSGLFYPGEGHVQPESAMAYLLDAAREAGAEIQFGVALGNSSGELVIDCRGLDARDVLSGLRGVRGERVVVSTPEIRLNRPVRLLHPRFPIYVVPWGGGRFMIGATQIESEEAGPVTLRSALELLSTAYALHPAFGEAQIVEFGAGLRPSFPDNLPRIVVRSDHIYVNGLFRHGFLLAPALAELTVAWVETGARHPEVFVADSSER
ncbi:MAG: FAD-dependent oxidoreductase [Pseudomonadota bacterium]|nr:FAD-dependent oxidoreductase [Pseudomonadota bacterium]